MFVGKTKTEMLKKYTFSRMFTEHFCYAINAVKNAYAFRVFSLVNLIIYLSTVVF